MRTEETTVSTCTRLNTFDVATPNFISRAAATRYFSDQGYADPWNVAVDKICAGEISIGRPHTSGDVLETYVDSDGRWHLVRLSQQ